MQVNLRENEIAKAVEQYLNRHGLKTRGLEVTVQFSMGKGANGLRAEVNIEGQDKPCDIPGFGPNDREIDIPLQLLDTVITEDEVKPGTLGALIQRHTEDVQVLTERQEFADKLANLAQQGEDTANFLISDLSEAEQASARGETPQEFIDAEEGKGAPWQTEEPVMETLAVVDAGPEPEITDAADDVGIDVGEAVATAHVDVEAEPQPEAASEPEPVVEAKPVRRPIFGKKPVAPMEPNPEPEVAAKAVSDQDTGGSLIPEEVSPVVAAELAKATTGPVRRSTSLFKKPVA